MSILSPNPLAHSARLPRLLFLTVALSLVASAACEDKKSGPMILPQGAGPAAALAALIDAAQKGDKVAFQRGLSGNFRGVISEYKKLDEVKPDIKGVFHLESFMVAFARSPKPSEEQISGTTASVRAKRADGSFVKTQMTMEDGQWRLEVPGQLAKMLDNPDDLEKLAKDEPIELRAKLPTGGGGSANHTKSLPKDATEAQKAKAKALDAFDLGIMSQADTLLADAMKKNPDDEDVAVALGRAYVQKSKGDEAVKALTQFMKKHPKAVRVKHYLGMALLMQNRAMEASVQWREIGKLDPAYAEEHNLEKRAAVAEKIAEGKSTAEILQEGGPALGKKGAPRKAGASSQPARSGPASQPAGASH